MHGLPEIWHMEDDTPKQPTANGDAKPRRLKPQIESYRRVAEQLIEEAMARGEFDDVPGKGKPLDLRPTEGDRQGTWAIEHVLSEGNFKPEWIEDRKDIEEKLAEARRSLARVWLWRQDALARGEGYAMIARQWDRAVAVFRDEVDKLNKRIRDYNLKAPTPAVHLRVINPQWEIAAVQRGE